MAKNMIAASPSEDDWQAQSDMRTLMEAEKIKGDPKRHGKAKAHAKKALAAMRAVSGEEADPNEQEPDADEDDGKPAKK